MLSDELTIPCFGSIKAGDTVHVQLVDGVPTAIGATGWGDDVSGRADAAQDAAEGAQAAAEGAQAAADAIGQHVWQDGSGVHVSEYEQDAPKNGKHESLFNSLGMLIRKRVSGAMRTLASFTQGGVAFYDGNGDAAENVMASFGAEGAQVGKASGWHTLIDSSAFSILKGAVKHVEIASGSIILGRQNKAYVSVDDDSLSFGKNYTELGSLFAQKVDGEPIVYLTNSGSSQSEFELENNAFAIRSYGSGNTSKGEFEVALVYTGDDHYFYIWSQGEELISIRTGGLAELAGYRMVTADTVSVDDGTSGVKPIDSDYIIVEGHTSGVSNGRFIKRTLSDFRKWVNDGIAVTEVEGTEISIAAGTSADATQIALSKSGYTPIGCVGFWVTGTNPGLVSFNNVHVSGSNLTFRCRNNGSSSTATVKPHFNILWLKD